MCQTQQWCLPIQLHLHVKKVSCSIVTWDSRIHKLPSWMGDLSHCITQKRMHSCRQRTSMEMVNRNYIIKPLWHQRCTTHTRNEKIEMHVNMDKVIMHLSTARRIVLCWWVTTMYEAMVPGFPWASWPFIWTERIKSSTTVEAIGSNPAVGSSYITSCSNNPLMSIFRIK